MEDFAAAEAAKYLGISREAVDAAARDGRLPVVAGGGPRRFSPEAVEEFHQLRQSEKIARLALSAETPVSVARKVRARLHATELGMPRPMSVKLAAMPSDWKMLFNRAELAAACVRDGEGCRWCRAADFAAVLKVRPVHYAEAYVELFGGQPCDRCGPGLIRPYMAALWPRVHQGAVRPSERAVAPSEVERARAREWVARRPAQAAAEPVQQDDDGRAMVASALRTARARLKAAKRAGDQRHALQLAQTIRSLEADAAVVDGRALSAAARPGRLRCGHDLSAGCGCPRHASKRATS